MKLNTTAGKMGITDFERIIKSKTLCLYLMGRPGEGKSAIIRSISKRNNWDFIDLRLSQIDESELLGLPDRSVINGTKVMEYCIPSWAFEANQKPTIIFFDELNRAKKAVRDAALQILLDRQIGHKFKFNENVYFASAGNLGDEDNCDVDEFDLALKGRLAMVRIETSFADWKAEYANENVNSYIVNFLENNPSYMWRSEENSNAYASPRSWSLLSDLIGKDEKDVEAILNSCVNFGTVYVGSNITRFIRYLEETISININDIINRFKQVEIQIKSIARNKVQELIKELEAVDLKELNKTQLENVCSFFDMIHPDERIGFFSKMFEKYLVLNDSKIEQAHDNIDYITRKYIKECKIIFQA